MAVKSGYLCVGEVLQSTQRVWPQVQEIILVVIPASEHSQHSQIMTPRPRAWIPDLVSTPKAAMLVELSEQCLMQSLNECAWPAPQAVKESLELVRDSSCESWGAAMFSIDMEVDIWADMLRNVSESKEMVGACIALTG